VKLSGLEWRFPLETVAGVTPVLLFAVKVPHRHLGVKGCHYHLGESNKRLNKE
jgi:hypothetical protein